VIWHPRLLMTITELANYIRKNKKGLNYPGVHPADDSGLVLQYTRHEMAEFVHITDQHVFDCCEKSTSYDEHIEYCRPLAKSDTEKFNFQSKHKPVQKGRTRRRFR
jgi:hypothetical protein